MADSAAGLQTSLDAVSAWGLKYRFTCGVGPTKSAAMIFGPRRNLPACNVTLGGVALSVVTLHKYLGVCSLPHTVLGGSRPALGGLKQPAVCTMRFLAPCRTPSVAHGVIHLLGVRLAQCYMGFGIPCWISTALSSLDRVLRRWGLFLLGWPAGSPNVGVLFELGWPDAERISSSRLLSLLGRVSSMTKGPLSNMCHSFGALVPDMYGVRSGTPSLCRRWSSPRWWSSQ